MSAAVRLHQPGEDPSRRALTPQMRLSEIAHAHYIPVYLMARDARPRHLEEVLQSLKYWIAFTQDPPIEEIDAWHTRDFVVGLKELPGKRQSRLAANTVRKHCGAIQAILDLCGPPAPRHRDALDLLARPPYIQRPRKHKKPAEDCFTLAEIEQLIANADAAVLPAGLPCSAGAYMRRIYLVTFNTAMRIGSTMQVCWSHYHGDYLLLPAGVAVKGSDDKRIELNAAARTVFDSMRGYSAERIFPWPSWPESRKHLYAQHERIRQCLPPERRFAFHGIRKLTNNELARINPKACEKALGHAGKVNVESYTSQVIVQESLAKLPTLACSSHRQTNLFDR